MGELLAGMMGWKINNPNKKNGEFFVHGNDIFTDYPLMMGNFDAQGDFSLSSVMTLSEYGKARKYMNAKK